LVHAAQEFEAQMMQELLKPMTSANGLDGEDGDSAVGSGGALGEFASESLGHALSERGGFGIASSIVRQMTYASNLQVTKPVTGKLHGNTVMKAYQ
jgi:Rod binding domain-containing protein